MKPQKSVSLGNKKVWNVILKIEMENKVIIVLFWKTPEDRIEDEIYFNFQTQKNKILLKSKYSFDDKIIFLDI